MCETMSESEEMPVRSRVKDEKETGRKTREASPDRNSPREPEILII